MWSEARTTWDNAMHRVATADPSAETQVRLKRLWLRRANRPILVTGRPGAGKSALYGALTGKVGLGYHTDMSSDWEPHKVKLKTPHKRARAAVIIVPGQQSEERVKALDRTIRNGRAPEGIIHVVCWGYNKLWSDSADGTVRELGTADTLVDNENLRDTLLGYERNDFAEMCQLIRADHVRRRLRWMIIVVAKADLYWNRQSDVRNYYIPGDGQSRFADILGGLVAGDRTLPPRIAIVPFSGFPQAHTYAHGLYRTPADLDLVQATALRNNLYDVLEGML
jgi:hypothetical protein